MSDEIKPALTAEEWTAPHVVREGVEFFWHIPGHELRIDDRGSNQTGPYIDATERHTLAALCLYKQPFGFSREDVDLLTLEIIRVQMVIQACGGPDKAPEAAPRWRKLLSLQARIAALLPPDTEERWPG